MDLTSFIEKKQLMPLEGEGTLHLTSIALDSRKVERGGLFVALPGTRHNGASFIEDALKKGACAVVVPEGVGKKISAHFKDFYPDVTFFEAPNIREVTSYLAAHFYPLQPKDIVAVTGTNGKTSVVSFIRQIWEHLDKPAASLGTLGLVIEGDTPPSFSGIEALNTPDPIRLHQILQVLKERKIEHLAFEASSHGLHQHRLDAVRLKAAVFTNFSNDHLDYHHTLESYFQAKCRLFQELMDQKTCAVLNTDIPEFPKLYDLCKKRNLKAITFGKQGETVRLISTLPRGGEQDVFVVINGQSFNFTLPLVGEFQAYNVVAAIGAVLACGGNATETLDACVSLKGVPGRLELVAPNIYVDYSHKPEALSLALKALRPHTRGKLCVVFGCGGNRDSLKRPIMGEIAEQLADQVIITDDNPRHEDPESIRQQILAKCSKAREIGSRDQAIKTAIYEMKPGDVVLIAGKGHESYQLVGDQAIPFNDAEEVQKCLRA